MPRLERKWSQKGKERRKTIASSNYVPQEESPLYSACLRYINATLSYGDAKTPKEVERTLTEQLAARADLLPKFLDQMYNKEGCSATTIGEYICKELAKFFEQALE